MTDTSSLVDRLRGRPRSDWAPRPPAAPADVEQLEAALEYPLPAQLRELLLYSDGGVVNGRASAMNIQSVDDTDLQRYNESFTEYIPTMLVFADDGAGNVYFFDPSDQLGHGRDAVYLVPMSSVRPERAVLVGNTLAETIEAVWAGANFTDRLFGRG